MPDRPNDKASDLKAILDLYKLRGYDHLDDEDWRALHRLMLESFVEFQRDVKEQLGTYAVALQKLTENHHDLGELKAWRDEVNPLLAEIGADRKVWKERGQQITTSVIEKVVVAVFVVVVAALIAYFGLKP